MDVSDDQLDQLALAFLSLELETGAKFNAVAAHVVNPHDFYVIPVNFLNNHYPLTRARRPLIASAMTKGRIVIYDSKNPEVNKYFEKAEPCRKIRGIIKNVDKESKCLIFALDYGFYERDITIDKMYYPLHIEGESMPPMAQRCTMTMCYPKKDGVFSQEAINAFREFLGRGQIKVTIHGKTPKMLKVSVFSNGPFDISYTLASSDFTCLADPQTYKLSYQHNEVQVGQTLTVRVQSGAMLHSFFVAPLAAFEEYLNKLGEFHAYCNSVPEINQDEFVPGRVIGVKLNYYSYYERAIILDTFPYAEKAKVRLVDWGTELDVSKPQIKAIKCLQFMNTPVCALYCSAESGFQPWDTGNRHFLTEGSIFNITIKILGQGFAVPHVVHIDRIH